MTSSRKTIIAVLATVIPLVVSMAMVEAGYRAYLRSIEFRLPDFEPAGMQHPVWHHDLKPDFSDVQYFGDKKAMYSAHYFTNNLGFRDSANAVITQEHTNPRLVFIGDSFTEGVGMAFEKTFVGVVKAVLRDTEVLNAGVSSFAPVLENLKIEQVILPLRPNRLVMLVDPSDVQDALTYHAWLSHGRGNVVEDTDSRRWMRNTLRQSKALSALLDLAFPNLLADPSKPRRLNGDLWTTYYEDRVRWLFDNAMFQEWGQQGLDLLLSDLAQTITMTRAAGIPLTFVIYPWPVHLQHPDAVVDWRGKMRALCEKNGVGLVDLWDTFQPSMLETHFLQGDVHWNATGHALVATRILEALRAQ